MSFKVGPGVPDFAGTRRFQVTRRLGSGGMGLVYEAYDVERDKRVALKTLQGVDPSDLFRLKREFRSLQGLEHRNLVRFGELVEEGGRWFFSMELVEGEDFIDYVRKPMGGIRGQRNASFAQCVDEERLRDAVVQLSSGLCALHDSGKVHRDIKPANIIVTTKGRVVLLDFGLIKDLVRVDHATTTDVVMGSAGYMSPEQATSQGIGSPADWYAMGSILYEALVGHAPFVGAFLEVLYAKVNSELPAPSMLVPDIPDDLDDLCVELLRVDPAQRPTGRAVLERLGEDPPTLRTIVAPAVSKASASARPSSDRQPVERGKTVPDEFGPPFLGREKELAVLRQAFADVGPERPVTVMVHGTSGLGKTTLVHRFLDEIRQSGRGAVILEGICHERESVPFKALDSAVDALSTFLRRLDPFDAQEYVPPDVQMLRRVFPVLDRADVIANAIGRSTEPTDLRELRRRAFAALKEMLARITKDWPLLAYVDDLQWGDVDSAWALAELLRAPRSPAVLFIGSHRSGQSRTSAFLETLAGFRRGGALWEAREIHLEPLPDEESRTLALRWLGHPSPPGADALVSKITTEAAGSPVAIRELSRYLLKRDVVATRRPLPQRNLTLETVIEARVAHLNEPGRRVMEVLCLAGRPLGSPFLVGAARLEGGLDEANSVLKRLLESDMVNRVTATSGEAFVLAREDLRKEVLAKIGQEERKNLHLNIASALLAGEEIDAESIFQHCFEAGDFAQAGRYAEQAAQAALKALAFDRAVSLFELAVRLSSGDPVRLQSLQLQLAEALASAGRRGEAGATYHAAADGAPPAQAFELRRRGMEHLLLAGRVDEALEVSLELLSGMGFESEHADVVAMIRDGSLTINERTAAQVSKEALTQLDASWPMVLVASVAAPLKAVALSHRHAKDAVEAGEAARAVRALALLLIVEGGRMHPGSRSRQRILHHIRRLSRSVDSSFTDAWLDLATGSAHFCEGRLRSAGVSLDGARSLISTASARALPELALASVLHAFCLVELGQVDEAARAYPRWARIAESRDDRGIAVLSMLLEIPCWLASDDPESAIQRLSQARELWDSREIEHLSLLAMILSGDVALYRGAKGLRAWLEAAALPIMRSGMARHHIIRCLVLSRRARVRVMVAETSSDPQERETLLLAAEKDAMDISLSGLPTIQPVGGLIRAGISAMRGDTSAGLELLDAAALDCDGLEGSSALGACARWRKGHLIGGADGHHLIAASVDYVRRLGVRNPERWLAQYTPGYGAQR